MSQKKNRIHDWHNLKWPFTVTFLYYSLLSLFTGVAEWSETGFVSVLGIALLIDAVAYISYCFFLSRDREDLQKLWFVFILAYLLATTEQLGIVWQRLSDYAAAYL